jgi:hypothetical protein
MRRRIPTTTPKPINGPFDVVGAGAASAQAIGVLDETDVPLEVGEVVGVVAAKIFVARPGFILRSVPFVELQVVVLSGPHHQFAGPSEEPVLANAHGYT